MQPVTDRAGAHTEVGGDRVDAVAGVEPPLNLGHIGRHHRWHARSAAPSTVTPFVMIDGVTVDGPTPEQLEQLARSIAMSGALGDRDRLDVVAALRRRAEFEKAVKRHPSNRRPPS
jgi:hypothetical protein